MLLISLSAAVYKLQATANTPVLLSAIFVLLTSTHIDSYVCVLCVCLYLCACVINAIAEHVVDSAVIARSAMLSWLCGGL